VICAAVEEALAERLLAGTEPAPEVSAHVAQCAACASHERLLAALGAALAGEEAPSPPAPEAVERARRRALRALRAHEPAPVRGLLGELAVAAAVLALALPFAFAHAWLVAEGAVALLGGLLPPLLLEGLGVVYFGSLALAMGTLFAVLPPWVARIRRGRMEAA
jgi:hypothetical protein